MRNKDTIYQPCITLWSYGLKVTPAYGTSYCNVLTIDVPSDPEVSLTVLILGC